MTTNGPSPVGGGALAITLRIGLIIGVVVGRRQR